MMMEKAHRTLQKALKKIFHSGIVIFTSIYKLFKILTRSTGQRTKWENK